MSPIHIVPASPQTPLKQPNAEVTPEVFRRNLMFSLNKAVKVAGRALGEGGRERFAAYKFLASMSQAAVAAGQQPTSEAREGVSEEEATELLALGLRTTPLGRAALRDAYEAMGDAVEAATCADDAAAVLSGGDNE